MLLRRAIVTAVDRCRLSLSPSPLSSLQCTRTLRSGPGGARGRRRRPPPLTPLTPPRGAAEAAAPPEPAPAAVEKQRPPAMTTMVEGGDREEEEEERAAAALMASRRARWEAAQRRAFEGEEEGEWDEGEDWDDDDDDGDDEEEEWEVDLRGEGGRDGGGGKRERRAPPDVLPQGPGDDGVGFQLPPYPHTEQAMGELLGDAAAIHQEEERWRRRLGLAPTSRESVFVAMRQRLQAEERQAAPSKRQLRMGAAIHTALSDAFYKDGMCPVTRWGPGGEGDGGGLRAAPLVEITEVNLSMDLRHAVVRWTPAVLGSSLLMGPDGASVGRGQEGQWRATMRLRRRLIHEIQAQLDKGTRRLRFECARRLKLKRVPALEFRPDEMVEAARAVDPLLGALSSASSDGGVGASASASALVVDDGEGVGRLFGGGGRGEREGARGGRGVGGGSSGRGSSRGSGGGGSGVYY